MGEGTGSVHCFGIADFEEVDALGLDLDELALGEASTPDADWVSLVQAELVHDLRSNRAKLAQTIPI